jgi:Bifunctional DNA primase/polymerase, N-terminal
MTRRTLRQALNYASMGWPVFPCRPGEKAPATRHGYLDATTDSRQISEWFSRHPDWNLAVATGAPGPDVLDIDQHGPAGNGFGAFARLRAAGLLDGATAYVRTPGGGQHAYFTGSLQRNGHLPAHHIDFRSAGGYVLVPPSHVDGRPYEFISIHNVRGELDWQAVTGLLEPAPQPQRPASRPAASRGTGRLAE